MVITTTEGVVDSPLVAPPAMAAAVTGIGEVCRTMFGMDLVPRGPIRPFSSAGMARGLCLSLVRPDGSWELGLFASAESFSALGRVLLGLSDDEEPATDELLDLVGEITNMTSGMVKRNVPEGRSVQLGVPLALLDADCRTFEARRILVLAQPLGSELFEGELILAFSTRDATALAGEMEAILGDADPSHPQLLARVNALIEELTEALGERAADATTTTLSLCATVLLDLVNEQLADPTTAYDWLRTHMGELLRLIREGKQGVHTSPPAPTLARIGDKAEQIRVERDAETLESLSDFLQESEEGLDAADRLLLTLESGAANAETVHALFRVFHSIKGVSSFLDINEVTTLAHTTETLLAMARDGKLTLRGGPLDVVFEATAMMRQQLATVRQAVANQLSLPPTMGLNVVMTRLAAAIRGEELPSAQVRSPEIPAGEASEDAAPKAKETVKIATDLVERLATIANSLSERSRALLSLGESNPELRLMLEPLLSQIGEVREVSSLMQMVSCSTLFQKMSRMVRDLAKKTGKLARLVLQGEDTMLGRAMLERLGDPLVHMIRNAVDHGIEESIARKEQGKPLMGTITLLASHQKYETGQAAVIELSDDGKGLHRDVILSKAISKAIVPADRVLSDQEVFQLIFAPGFSTAAAVTAISGRGVGMDVVKRAIESLGGRIDISSQPGHGSRFRIILPLTL
jgi:signal transduction histidine kinase